MPQNICQYWIVVQTTKTIIVFGQYIHLLYLVYIYEPSYHGISRSVKYFVTDFLEFQKQYFELDYSFA